MKARKKKKREKRKGGSERTGTSVCVRKKKHTKKHVFAIFRFSVSTAGFAEFAGYRITMLHVKPYFTVKEKPMSLYHSVLIFFKVHLNVTASRSDGMTT